MEAETILRELSEPANPVGDREVREFYKGKAQNGHKRVGQTNGYQI
ncbi:MAG: hypothetical protein JWP57_1755 [Spirosoma sp.]|nr:hypothetical protein [Spirosoma sp.]